MTEERATNSSYPLNSQPNTAPTPNTPSPNIHQLVQHANQDFPKKATAAATATTTATATLHRCSARRTTRTTGTGNRRKTRSVPVPSSTSIRHPVFTDTYISPHGSHSCLTDLETAPFPLRTSPLSSPPASCDEHHGPQRPQAQGMPILHPRQSKVYPCRRHARLSAVRTLKKNMRLRGAGTARRQAPVVSLRLLAFVVTGC
jgi:hypothetical protein